MKHTLLCFSGTGNSYYVAKNLADALGDANLVMIPKLVPGEKIELTEAVGLIFPTHFLLPPTIVAEFIQERFSQLDLTPVQYLYLVTTKNLSSGWTSAITEILLRNQGIALSYASSVRFPNTYIPLFTAPDLLQIEFYYKWANKKIAKIVQDLRRETIRPPVRPPFTRYMIEQRMEERFEKTKISAYDSFVVTNACDGCELCYRICPTANITMVDEKPTFGVECTFCLACYHRCPKEAIAFNRRVSSGYYPNHEAQFNEEYRK